MSSAASNDRRWNVVRVGAVVVYLLCASLLGFRSPGLYYDEAIFLNGAVHMLNSSQEPPFAHDPWSWGTMFGRRVPIMVLPYVGAIRDYLVFIPFALFGPNYYTARIPAALVGAFGIWGLSVLLRNQIGAQAAAIASLALAIHPAYLALTLYDKGVAEWFAPFGALSITLACYLSAPTASRAFWLGVAMGLGVWSRANVVWLLGSATLAGLIVLGKRACIPARQLAALVAGGCIGAAPLLWYEVRSKGATFTFLRSMADPTPLLSLAVPRLYLLSQILLSDHEHRDMWNAPPPPLCQIIVLSSIVAIALYVCLRRSDLAEPRQIAFGRVAALTFLFLAGCMFLSRLNVTEHHLIALAPIAIVLIVIAAQDVCRRWRGARYVVAAIAVFYLNSALQRNLTVAAQIQSTGGIGWWSNAIDPLTDYLERHCQGRMIKVLDWGLNNNLYILSGARISSMEVFWGATVERSGSGKLWKDELSPGDIYVLHAPGLEQSPDAAKGFRRALAASALAVRRTGFLQKTGAGYAEVVEILPTAK